MGWIGCICCEKFRRDFVARTFALVRPILHRVRKATKRSWMNPNSTKRNKMSVYGPMGWIESVHCEKFRCDFMAWTCALIAPVQPVLHWVLWSNEILPNTPKHYETHANMSGPMGWIGCVCCEKFWCDFMARTSALIAPVQPVLHRVSCWTKHCQMHPNTMRRTKTWV